MNTQLSRTLSHQTGVFSPYKKRRRTIKWSYFFATCLSFLMIVVPASSHDCEDHDCTEARSGFVSTKGSSGLWLIQSVPKSEWSCTRMEDLGSPSKTCEMCEREIIRYAHTMSHDSYKDLVVGCICAGHMEGDIDSAKGRDAYFKSRTQRRAHWLELSWKTSKRGNSYLNTRTTQDDPSGHHITMVTSKYGQHSAIVDGISLNQWFSSMDSAKYAAFDYLCPSSKKF